MKTDQLRGVRADGGEVQEAFFPAAPELLWQPEGGPEPEEQVAGEPGVQVVRWPLRSAPPCACRPGTRLAQVIFSVTGPVEVVGQRDDAMPRSVQLGEGIGHDIGFRSPYGR